MKTYIVEVYYESKSNPKGKQEEIEVKVETEGLKKKEDIDKAVNKGAFDELKKKYPDLIEESYDFEYYHPKGERGQ